MPVSVVSGPLSVVEMQNALSFSVRERWPSSVPWAGQSSTASPEANEKLAHAINKN